MFLVELIAGAAAGSVSLQADAMDFLGDAANYLISLLVLGMTLQWRARAALLKGLSLGVVGLWVAGQTAWNALYQTVPQAEVMGIVGVLALAANVACALMLYFHRHGDANRRSVWICSRNDAIANIAVLAAALGVFGTGTGWPDIIVAAVMAGLSVSGATQIIRQSLIELRSAPASAAAG
jgi:Co/Zn/Cd efflux system component